MSELAISERLRKQGWAAPGGAHDAVIKAMKIALPMLVGVLMAYLAMAPLARTQDISFILDKNKVEVAKERMKIQTAQYRGADDRGRPFTIAARSAVQATSHDPVVDIRGMAAQIQLDEGPASVRADRSRYNMESERVAVVGPILVTGPDNYRLETRDVVVDLNRRNLASTSGVDGKMPLGSFSAGRLEADLDQRKVALSDGARLHIVQGGLR
jgi:lipopolysaccharide export system protein LptC